MNISPEQRLLQVRANLERLRWLDQLLEPTMLVVDIAGARLLYFRDGDIVWRTRTRGYGQAPNAFVKVAHYPSHY